MKQLECLPFFALLPQRCNETATRAERTSAERESRDTAAALASERISLFISSNLDGWQSHSETAAGPAWNVEDGVIVLDGDSVCSE
ncbi:MAG: hypothetical protein RIA65_11735 [Woeseia sp.]